MSILIGLVLASRAFNQTSSLPVTSFFVWDVPSFLQIHSHPTVSFDKTEVTCRLSWDFFSPLFLFGKFFLLVKKHISSAQAWQLLKKKTSIGVWDIDLKMVPSIRKTME